MSAKIWFPAAVVLLGVVWVGAKALPRSTPANEMDLDAFGQITVQYQGRFMPLDTVARHHLLLQTGGKQTYYTAPEGSADRKSESATHWFLEVAAAKEKATRYQVIRVDNPDVRQFLQLEKRPGNWKYSVAELTEAFDARPEDVTKIVRKARDEKPLTEFEKALMSTRGQVFTVFGIEHLSLPGLIPDPNEAGVWISPREVDFRNAEQYRSQALADAEKSVRANMAKDPARMQEAREKMGDAQFNALVDRITQEAAEKRLEELLDEHRKDFAPQSAAFHKIIDAYRDGKVAEFNAAVREYRETYSGLATPGDLRRSGLEYFLNRFEPFFICQMLYFLVVILAAVSWLGWAKPANNAATALALFTVLVHTFGLALRVVISEKPPVTNLYSSAVFIGWGGLLLCLGLYLYYRNGLGNFTGGLLGLGTMFLAKFLEANGDTMPRVEAVLNTNFWLSSHVTLVTLGYSATAVAGTLGIVYLVVGLFTPWLKKKVESGPGSRWAGADVGRVLYGMIYGVTCFAALLSFVGTVLGGFWADDSWGRFWGWDPKENGAVLVVMWNVLNLHLRWAGMVRARGFAVVAVLGNVVTAWSYFGTNQLGIGLHAYGFDDKLATGCAIFWISQFCIAALGLVPLKYWASFGSKTPAAKA